MVVRDARYLRAGEPGDGAVEVVECLLGHHRRYLSAVATEPVVLINHEALAGLAHGIEDGFLVERPKRPEIDDLDTDPFVHDDVGGLERVVRHQPVRDHGELRALAGHGRTAERDCVVRIRHVTADRSVHLLVLEEEHRIVVPDRGPQQALGVVWRGRDDDLQARDVGEERLHGLGVIEGAVDAAAVRSADGHRDAEAVVRAVPHPCGLGQDLVEGREDEVRELDLGHGPQAIHRGTDRGAHDHRFGQRRVDDPVIAELGPQAVRDQEHAALLADVLTQHDHARIAPHFVGQRLPDRLDEGLEGHQSVAPSAADRSSGPP